MGNNTDNKLIKAAEGILNRRFRNRAILYPGSTIEYPDFNPFRAVQSLAVVTISGSISGRSFVERVHLNEGVY